MKTQMTTTLYNLVVKALHPDAEPMQKDEIDKWLQELPKIANGLFKIMSILVFSPVPADLVNRHIRQIHHESICLIDILQTYQGVAASMQPLHLEILNTLTCVIAHIKIRHPAYFNLDLPIPKTEFRLAVDEIEGQMNLTLSRLKSKSTDKALQRLIQDSLTDFTKASQCTYYRLAYINALQASITRLCEITERELVDEQLRELLIYLNLNTAMHLKYYKKMIALQLSETFELQEQHELLCAYQKQFKSISPQRDTGFNPRQDSIKTMLLDFIRAELKYRLKTQQSLTTDQQQGSNMAWAQPLTPYKIQVAFSVDALAYFLKLLIKAGLVQGNPRSQLLLFVSKTFRTTTTEKISSNSLSRKYDQVVQTTARAVRLVLVRMLKILDEEFKLT